MNIWYNSIVKKLVALTTALLAAFSAIGTITAFAAESNTIYPQDTDFIKSLTFSSLSDYAVDGETYVFAEGSRVYVFENGNLSETTLEDCKYEFNPSEESIALDSYLYHFDGDGALPAYNTSTKTPHTFSGNYTDLKQYGGKVYAVKENSLYCFNGAAEQKISLEYADFSATQKISVGQSPYALKNYSSLKFVTVEAGTYMTEVDLTELEDEYFVCGDTVTVSEKKVALLLCETGNASIIAIGDESYILLKSKTEQAEVNCYVEKEFENATIIGNKIYASPYVIIGTSSFDNAAGSIVSVLNKLEYEGVLGSAYYEVLYMTENGTKVGYVADGFLTEYIIEDNKKPSVTPDPDHSEKDNVKTVLLVLAVVVLVLVAVGYIAHIGLSDKRKKQAKEKEQKKPPSAE